MEKQLKILLATDYSEAVMSAERYAVQFSQKHNASLTVMHIYEIPFNFPAEPLEYAKAAENLRKLELQKLEQHCYQLFNKLNVKWSDVNFECIVREGTVGKQIRKEAEHANMNLVITGAHGNGGFKDLLLGSHTWDVIKGSEVPVLVIPKNALLVDIKNIVFATEYREGEIPGIYFLVELAKQFNAQLTVLHITNNTILKEHETYLLERFTDEVKNRVMYNKLKLHFVQSNDIVKGLHDFCSLAKTDWLVMSPEKPFFLQKIFNPARSITKRMTFHTDIPLLAVPDFFNMDRWNSNELKMEEK